MDIKVLQGLHGLLPHPSAVDEWQSNDALDYLSTKKHIAANIQIVRNGQILIDCLDARIPCLMRCVKMYYLATILNSAPIGLVDSGDRLNQCRFARAVVSCQGENLARIES
jgi:hypothetical protein